MSSIGNRIKKLRAELGMSLQDLATATESSKGYLWEIENRNNANPSINKLVRIAEALGVAPSFLLGEGKLIAPSHNNRQPFTIKDKS